MVRDGVASVERTPSFIAPMIPTVVAAPPTGEGWIHEIKHDVCSACVLISIFVTLRPRSGCFARAVTRTPQTRW